MKMQYHFLQLNVRQGEIETKDTSVHKGEFDEDEYASEYLDEGTGQDGCYEFIDGNVCVEVDICQKITKKEYDVMNKYL